MSYSLAKESSSMNLARNIRKVTGGYIAELRNNDGSYDEHIFTFFEAMVTEIWARGGEYRVGDKFVLVYMGDASLYTEIITELGTLLKVSSPQEIIAKVKEMKHRLDGLEK